MLRCDGRCCVAVMTRRWSTSLSDTASTSNWRCRRRCASSTRKRRTWRAWRTRWVQTLRRSRLTWSWYSRSVLSWVCVGVYIYYMDASAITTSLRGELHDSTRWRHGCLARSIHYSSTTILESVIGLTGVLQIMCWTKTHTIRVWFSYTVH